MIIYPSLEIKNGQCVRLHRGDMTTGIVYNESPAEQALAWARAGFSWLHVVDLDGAAHGVPENHNAVREILQAVDIPIQLGGGIRTHGQIAHWLSEGVSRVVLGTAAVRDAALVREVCAEFPGQIALSIDARQGRVSVEGWVSDANISAVELARHFEDAGAAALIYTDIDRDGTERGIDLHEILEVARATSIPVIAAGGVGSIADIRAVQSLHQEGVEGLIIGSALYDGTLDPREVLAAAAGL